MPRNQYSDQTYHVSSCLKNMRKKTRKRKSGKGKIIRNYREFIEKDGADFSPKTTTIPHSKSKGKGSGIYALYDNST